MSMLVLRGAVAAASRRVVSIKMVLSKGNLLSICSLRPGIKMSSLSRLAPTATAEAKSVCAIRTSSSDVGISATLSPSALSPPSTVPSWLPLNMRDRATRASCTFFLSLNGSKAS
eukprot:16610_4